MLGRSLEEAAIKNGTQSYIIMLRSFPEENSYEITDEFVLQFIKCLALKILQVFQLTNFPLSKCSLSSYSEFI